MNIRESFCIFQGYNASFLFLFYHYLGPVYTINSFEPERGDILTGGITYKRTLAR